MNTLAKILSAVALATTACGGGDASDEPTASTSASSEALTNGSYYVVHPPDGLTLYTENGPLRMRFCAVVQVLNQANGWAYVYYTGEYHYHPAARGWTTTNGLAHTAYSNGLGCGA